MYVLSSYIFLFLQGYLNFYEYLPKAFEFSRFFFSF